MSDLGEPFARVVLPKSFRAQVLNLAHSTALAGHLSLRKTLAIIKRSFTWPNLGREVKRFCRACPS